MAAVGTHRQATVLFVCLPACRMHLKPVIALQSTWLVGLYDEARLSPNEKPIKPVCQWRAAVCFLPVCWSAAGQFQIRCLCQDGQ